jgi:hypothetical protein
VAEHRNRLKKIEMQIQARLERIERAEKAGPSACGKPFPVAVADYLLFVDRRLSKSNSPWKHHLIIEVFRRKLESALLNRPASLENHSSIIAAREVIKTVCSKPIEIPVHLKEKFHEAIRNPRRRSNSSEGIH